MKISVIVCTHNRSDLLPRTLESLLVQDYPASEYEVIVVDNRSTDGTKEAVSRLKDRVRYVYEETIGLSHARNRGIRESRGEIVAFIDDDARAEKNWLSAIHRAFDGLKDAACVGGKVLLEWAAPRPSWWTDNMNPHLSAVDYGNQVKKLGYPAYPFGTNIVFKREAAEKAGGFNPELGRIGKKFLAGEEIEICLTIEKQGGGIYYSPEMVVHHWISPDRVTRESIYRKSYWHGRSCALVENRHFAKKTLIKRIVWMALEIGKTATAAFRDIYTRSILYYRWGFIHQACLCLVSPSRKV